MADEMLKNSRATSGNSGDHPDNSSDSDSVQNGQPTEKEVDEVFVWKNKYIELLADLQNTKKRLSRSAAQEVEADKKALLLDVLPVADGLDLALAHMSSEEDSRNILQGIELIRNILDKFFKKYEVKAIDAWGKPFDPAIHQAIGVIPHAKFPPNTVVKVEQRGYLYREKLLRPAQVIVVSR